MLIVILVHDSLFVLFQVHRARLCILSSGRHCCLQQKERWRQTLKLSHMLIFMYHRLSLLVLCGVSLSLSQSTLSLCHCLCSSVTEMVAQLVSQSVCLSVTSLFTNCASLSGLALACPWDTLLQHLEGLIRNGSCAEVFCFAHMMPFDPSTTLFWVQFCRTMSMSLLVLATFTSFSSTLSGMFVHDSSKRFIQRPILIVLNVYMTLVAGSPANSTDVF